jgi:acetyl-CoA C-acetyltransferase
MPTLQEPATRKWPAGLPELVTEAVDGVMEQSGLDRSDIEAVFVANKAAGNFEGQHHLNAMVSQEFSHFPPAMRVEAACASGGLALLAAEQALLAGRYKTVLVVGVEKMTDVTAEETTHILSGAADHIWEYGSTFPALYALLTQLHMAKYGTTREQLSAVAVKNHRHALTNPQAQFHKELTVEQVSNSTLVADPLRILDCSPITDGAAAVILSTKAHRSGVQVVGMGHGQDTLDLASRADLTGLAATTRAAQAAYAEAGVISGQIKLAEVHDCFTIAELLAIEDLGLVTQGQAGLATLKGETTLGSKLVVNPSGGLKACGHPVGATGVKQLAYLAEVLAQGQADYALAHNVGGSGATAVVHILHASKQKGQS